MMENETLCERLQQLRKAHGYSQEQLADLVGISRQAVSKWESGASLPDINNLVRLSELYGETLDSLVKGNAVPQEEGSQDAAVLTEQQLETVMTNVMRRRFGWCGGWSYEYTSKTRLFGLPLVHVHLGRNKRTGRFAVSKGIISVGMLSCGVVSVGILSVGLLSVGVLALGLLSLGVWAVGLCSAGIWALGVLLAAGIIAVGYYTFGVAAMGVYCGGVAAAATQVAVAVSASAPVAIGTQDAKGLHTLLVTGETTLEQARQFLLAYAPQMPAWLLESFAKLTQIL